jgi:integrase
MASVWLVGHTARDGEFIGRTTKDGAKRYRVEYRLGGRESPTRYGGQFKTKREALERKAWIAGELAARRVPDLGSLEPAQPAAPTFSAAATRWLASRLDVADGTRVQQRTSIGRAVRVLGPRRVDAIGAHDVAAMIAELHAEGLKPSYIRKVQQATAMLFDFAGVSPNPARDRVTVRLPADRAARAEPADGRPPARRARAPPAPLPAAAARPRRDRDAARRARDAHLGRHGRATRPLARLRGRLEGLPPRRPHPERRVFQGFGGDRFRTAVTRACTAAGVPAFSPHDLRHRRISLLHLGGVPWARIGEHVGQRNLAVPRTRIAMCSPTRLSSTMSSSYGPHTLARCLPRCLPRR